MSEQNHGLPQPIRVAGVEIPVQEQSPLALLLVSLIQKQAAEIQELRDEIQRLKGTARRPTIKAQRVAETRRKKGNATSRQATRF